MKLHTLLKFLHPLVPYNGDDPEITAIHNDNRLVEPGSLFICIKGHTVDGHDFAQSAVEKGAAAILAERDLQLDVPVIIVKIHTGPWLYSLTHFTASQAINYI